MNELLDKCIEEVSQTQDIYKEQEEAFKQSLAPALDEFTTSVSHLNERLEEKALSMLNKDDKSKLKEMMDAEEEHNHSLNHLSNMPP